MVYANSNMVHNTKNGNIAVVYARYSSHSQGEQSIEGQLTEAHRYAQTHGYTIVHEYIDRAKSGRTDSREEFQRMLRDTAKRKFDIIIVWKVDRFGRNREEITFNKYKCKKNNVRVEYVAEVIPNTPEGVILESVLEGVAEYYSLQLSQNIKRGQRESAEKCQSVGGNRPLGYLTGTDKKFIIDKKTAPTVKMIFSMYAKGNTVTEIINHLNKLGLRTLRNRPFTKNSLHSILKNEKYIGNYIFKDRKIEGGMPQIIDNDTFWKVQELLKVNKRAPANKWSKADYLLTNKLFCGKCGAQMVGESGTGKSGQKYNYYICVSKKRLKSCAKKAVRQKWIEHLVIDQTKRLLEDNSLLELIVEQTWQFYLEQDELKEELKTLKCQLAQTETAIQNLMRAIEAGILNDVTKKRMDELTQQQKELAASIAEREVAGGFRLTKGHIVFFLNQFKEGDFSDKEFQKRLVSTFINSVFVYDDKVTINYNYSSDSSTVTLNEVDTSNTSDSEVFGCHAKSTTIPRG